MMCHKKSWAVLAAGLLFAAASQAGCYTVINGKGIIVSQTSTPPVDMSRPLHETIPVRYGKGARMIFGVADDSCGPEVEPWFAPASHGAMRPARADRG